MITIRLADTRDLPHLPAIERSAAQAFLGTPHAWCAAAEVMPEAEYLPLLEGDAVWVAENHGVLAGFVTTEIEGDQFHVWELAVHTDHQRKGVGKALLATCVEAAREEECRYLTLSTFTNVEFNEPYYRKLGWRIETNPSAWLTAVMANEVVQGFTDRCAMRLDL